MHYIIGIDEAGRWAWAWPIVAGGFMMESEQFRHISEILEWINDSKKLTKQKREWLFSSIEHLSHKSECQYTFAYREADSIDAIGIREANRECMEDVIVSFLQYLSPIDSYEVWIDGCDNYRFHLEDTLYIFAKKKNSRSKKQKIGEWHWVEDCPIPEKMKNTLTFLIDGDALHPAISLGSIIAKVVRDRMMCEYSEDFPLYGFESHVGYGTRKHMEALHTYNITPIHRKSYAPVKRLISGASSI